MKRRRSGLLLAIGLLAAAASPVAGWRGSAALEVKVEDHRGRDLAGAEIELRFLEGTLDEGPAVVKTDANGRAAIGGLAPGRWRLTVRRASSMSFSAEVALAAGEKPAMIAAVHENVPGATGPMRVRLTRGDSSAPVPPERQPAASPAVIASPPVATPRPSAPPPTPTPAPAVVIAPPARPTETPAPAATAQPPSPRPAPPPARPPVVVTPTPAATVPAPPVAGPPTPRESPPPTAVPSLRVETPPAPAPALSTPPPAAAAPLPVAPPRRHADRSCPECRPGEAAVSVEIEVTGGGAACPAGAAEQLAGLDPSRWAEWAASLPAGCGLAILALPAGGRYTGYRFEAGALGESQDCLAGRVCAGLACTWLADPALDRRGRQTRLAALLDNRSPGPRRGRLTAYFIEPRR